MTEMTFPLPDPHRSLRTWQAAALNRYAQAGEPQDYLVTATPGAGKTTFALTFAASLVQRRIVRRVVVVAPTDHLRTQWAEEAAGFGIFLDPSLSNDVGPVSSDYDGYVATYAQIALKPALHARRVEQVPTLVILDEVHHAGDGLTWGDGVREAFDEAKRRLCLTGTPFRTSASETIPFVRYVSEADGSMRSEADYTYGYSDALKEHVVRPVMFAAYSGVARWRTSAGDVISASLSSPSTKDEEMTAWRTALNPAGQWIPHVIAAADQRLTEVRAAGMTDAGAMILAGDQEHARAYAAVIERITGTKPTLVLSEDSTASERITRYSQSTDRWLVAVRMVSEGVNIPRLAVGVWGTSYRTPLFFAQAVGRFVRARRKGETATVFLPAVRPILALAADLEDERDHVIAPAKTPDGELEWVQPEIPEPAMASESVEALDAEAEFAHVLFGGQAITADMPPMTIEDEEYLGLPGLLDPAQMASLLKQREAEMRRVAQTHGSEVTPAQMQQQRVLILSLRKEINTLVNRVAARKQRPHAQVHAQVRKAVPGPPSPSASVDVLEARRDHLLGMLA